MAHTADTTTNCVALNCVGTDDDFARAVGDKERRKEGEPKTKDERSL
jgi:hypothetical protein